jgi:ribose 5-phosphate isomerase B
MAFIAIGSDHAAFLFKEEIKVFLLKKGHTVKDFGTSGTEPVDYCEYGFAVAESVSIGDCELGILFCGTGVGMAISANKVKGIRAVVCSEPYSAKLSKAHNDTNVLALGARVVGIELAKMIIDEWLNARFEGERHVKRIQKISDYENSHCEKA